MAGQQDQVRETWIGGDDRGFHTEFVGLAHLAAAPLISLPLEHLAPGLKR